MFEVGDRVEVINNGGGNAKYTNIGDTGIIVEIRYKSKTHNSIAEDGRKGIVHVIRDSDKKRISMYPFRFKKINREEIIYDD